jgi:hypothetical protein
MSSHILAFKVIQLLDEKLKQTPAKVSKGGFTSLKHTHTHKRRFQHTHTQKQLAKGVAKVPTYSVSKIYARASFSASTSSVF